MSGKLLALFILSILAGVAFIGLGVYFLSVKFANKLIETTLSSDDKIVKKLIFRAKGSGYTAISTGAITIMWGILIYVFPQIISILALIYMIFLIVAFSAITFIFK